MAVVSDISNLLSASDKCASSFTLQKVLLEYGHFMKLKLFFKSKIQDIVFIHALFIQELNLKTYEHPVFDKMKLILNY